MKEICSCYICQLPHNNEFMVCCGKCLNWFHGECMKISRYQCKDREEAGQGWECSDCIVAIRSVITTNRVDVTKTDKSSTDGIGKKEVGSKSNVNEDKINNNELSKDHSTSPQELIPMADLKVYQAYKFQDDTFCSELLESMENGIQ